MLEHKMIVQIFATHRLRLFKRGYVVDSLPHTDCRGDTWFFSKPVIQPRV